MARRFSKGHPTQYLYRRINRKVGPDSAGDSLRLRPPTRPSVLPGKFQGIQRWGLAVSWSACRPGSHSFSANSQETSTASVDPTGQQAQVRRYRTPV